MIIVYALLTALLLAFVFLLGYQANERRMDARDRTQAGRQRELNELAMQQAQTEWTVNGMRQVRPNRWVSEGNG